MMGCKTTLRVACLGAVSVLALTVSAAAQTVTATAQNTSGVEQVVVTGTHIARPEVESAMPITVTRMEDAKNFARDTVYDALELNPAIGPGIGENNSNGQEYDKGVANINLRNLGTNRSLVLVDGQRWVAGSARSSAVDLNTIPTAMIDRIEVVTGGAAAIYGADAVSGAVNVVMKKEFSGLELSGTTGISQHGDANQSNFTFATGLDFAGGRGHFVLGGDFAYTAPLETSDRFTNRQTYYANPANTGPHDGIPDNILTKNWEQLHRAPIPTFCLLGNKNCYDTSPSANGTWYQLVNGAVTQIPSSNFIQPGPGEVGFEDATAQRNGANAWENIMLRDKSVKGSIYAHTTYELSPNLTWNATFSYAHSYDRGTPEWPQIRDDARPTNWWGGTTSELATLTNPYLPASLSSFMTTNGITSLRLDRTYLNLPRNFENHDRNTFTYGTDLGGKFLGDLSWSAFARYGQNIDHVTTTNMVGRNEWLNARNVVTNASGAIVCADPTAVAAGCAPFNPFSTSAPSQSWINYAEFNRNEQRENSLFNTGLSMNGNLFNLPYGAVSVASGVEYRREGLHTKDDPNNVKLTDIIFAPGEDYALHPNLDKARDTYDVYGEVVVPLLANLPLANRLEIEGAYRESFYSDNPETGTWKLGLNYSPISDFTFRGVYSFATRVPNFGELYSPLTSSTVGQIQDPCQVNFITQNANRAANCAAVAPSASIPLPFPNTNAPVLISGGNPGLTPEKSDSYSLGGVFTPSFFSGFDMTVDYWDINIKNVITSLDYLSLLQNCVDAAGGPSQTYCGFITRNPDGSVNNVRTNFANLAAQHSRGIDFGASYRTDLGDGVFHANFNGTYLLEQTTVAQVGKPGIDFSGAWQYPHLKFTLMTDYTIGEFTFGVNTRFIERSLWSATAASLETFSEPYVPAYLYNDITVQYRPADEYAITFGVKNVSNVGVFGPLQDNVSSPHLTNGATQSNLGTGQYDAIGRYFFIKADIKLDKGLSEILPW